MWSLSFDSIEICTLLRNKINQFSRMITNIHAYFNITGSKVIYVTLFFCNLKEKEHADTITCI